jgi:acyl-CoA synthetase (AMP-forming)/AMP-acid ligase II
MPLFHGHGLIGATLSALFAGARIVLPDRFSAHAFWPLVKAHTVTWYSAVPTIHQILLARAVSDHAPSRSGLRFIRSCSAALAPATLHQLEERFGAPVLEAYAMTETAHQVTSNPLPPARRKAGSVGPGTHVDVAIMAEDGTLLQGGQRGEVVVRGATVMQGYYRNPEANQAAFTNGWFRTGDLGVLDSDGYLRITGRIKELINRGGEKISPAEIDAVLLSDPAVAEAAAFAVPDPIYGEEIQAAVVLQADITAAALQAYCRSHLSDFEIPKVIHVVKELPKDSTGKVERRRLTELFAK